MVCHLHRKLSAAFIEMAPEPVQCFLLAAKKEYSFRCGKRCFHFYFIKMKEKLSKKRTTNGKKHETKTSLTLKPHTLDTHSDLMKRATKPKKIYIFVPILRNKINAKWALFIGFYQLFCFYVLRTSIEIDFPLFWASDENYNIELFQLW